MDIKNKINIDEFEINYVYKKDKNENGSLVLFLHGFSDSYTSFTSLFNRQDRTYNYAAIDFPGCGKSSSKDNLSLHDYARVAKKFVNTVLKDENDIIVASHSLGAFSALSVLDNKRIKKAILISPFNYKLNSNNSTKKENLKRWLLPNTLEEAEDAYLSFFANVTPTIIRSSKLYSQTMVSIKDSQKTKFEYMLDNEILNDSFLQTTVKDLYFKNKNYCILVGSQDKFTTIKELNEVAEETQVEYVNIWNAGHAIFVDAGDFVNNFINQKSQKNN